MGLVGVVSSPTSWPPAMSASARWEPTNPAAPVTSTRMSAQDLRVIEQDEGTATVRCLGAQRVDGGNRRLTPMDSAHPGDGPAGGVRDGPVVRVAGEPDHDRRSIPDARPERDRGRDLSRRVVVREQMMAGDANRCRLATWAAHRTDRGVRRSDPAE